MKKIILLCVFFVCFLLVSPRAHAQGDFVTSFDVTYTVNESGKTHAAFYGRLTNNVENKYASFYTLKTGFSDIENIRASDDLGSIKPTLTTNGIQVLFNDHVVGIGNTLTFTISFDTTDIAKHNGDIWEINIPGISNQEDFKNFTVHLSVPQSFGQVSYIKPNTAGSSLNFDKATLGTSGISIAFGTEQSYAFSLQYHLQNTNFFPINTQIALPPTTNYQTVAIDSISPKPTNVVIDKDGNWLAQYQLLPSEKISVTVTGRATLTLSPKQEKLSPNDYSIYLQSQQYWDTANSDIKKLAQDLKTPDAIFQYVVTHLSYDFSRVAGTQVRVGAASVLKNPTSAVCLEFTDLFIALARAAGIPAREIDGFAFTQNLQERPLSQGRDILHAWPEYYDEGKQTWVMVDPTWENTTHGVDYFSVLDFDHVAFAIRGVSSTTPIPAGGYKFLAAPYSKDINVTFGEPVQEEVQKAGFAFTTAQTVLSGFPIVGMLYVKNAGTQLIDNQQIVITASDLAPHSQTISTGEIPPFGSVDKTIGFNKTPLLTNGDKTITIQLAGNTIKKSVHVYPFFLKKEYIIGGILFVVLCIILFILAARPRRVSVS